MDRERLLPRSAPSAQGMHAARLLALLDDLQERRIECHSLMVVRHGHVVAEGWWRPYSAERPHLLYSMTKSFTAVAVGLAVADGLLALNDRVLDVLDDHVPADLPARAGRLTVRHLLTMTTGHRTDPLEAAWACEPADLVKGFLRIQPQDPPGTRHAYNNPAGFVLARMVERVTGRGLAELLDDRLFGPMGVRHREWDTVASGAAFGFHGLHLRTEAVAAFGELLLRGGRRRDPQLVPRAWLELATRRHVETRQFEDGSRTADWLEGYGYHFWMSRHGYRADGAFGQYCLVLPEHDLVVAMTAATTDMQAPLDAVWDSLLPGLDGEGDAGSDRTLADCLRDLSLPLVPGELAPGRRAHAVVTDAPDNPLPLGASIAVEPAPGGWRVRIDTGDLAFDLEVGHQDWRESAPLGRPVVATGAWQGTVFVADLYVITGPHRVRLTVDAPGAVATWNITPRVGPGLLRQLRAPPMTRPDVA
ncbi:serine hydrolase domain-containing protein [Nonomuraea aridisoli]|uniref:Serine hydrolase n=1 Tax=Nonomuraea aridisoli TaxID=2070368 RepID=A0A2W2E8L3_9ACTN|nr:serine hydrolase domain-containing protein [Nonomuraea aridisoli]PZG08328.1 serine hydrolase [Nonomuraea aridisoli]